MASESLNEKRDFLIKSLQESDWYAEKVLSALKSYGPKSPISTEDPQFIMEIARKPHLAFFTNEPSGYNDKVFLLPSNKETIGFFLAEEIARSFSDMVDISRYSHFVITPTKENHKVEVEAMRVSEPHQGWFKKLWRGDVGNGN